MKRKVISMILRRWKGFCLAAEEEALFPRGAEMCGEVFAPLVFLVRRDPLRARGLYPIRDLSELDEPEGIGCLTPSSPAEGELAAFVRAHGAGVLNAAFSRAFSRKRGCTPGVRKMTSSSSASR